MTATQAQPGQKLHLARSTSACGASPGSRASSTSGLTAANGKAKLRKIAARNGDELAKTNFIKNSQKHTS